MQKFRRRIYAEPLQVIECHSFWIFAIQYQYMPAVGYRGARMHER
jgi:hypothetical protein